MLSAFMLNGRPVMLVVEDGLAALRTDTGWIFLSVPPRR